MTEGDKKQMQDSYMKEIGENTLNARSYTAAGFIRGYEIAFSLHLVRKRFNNKSFLIGLFVGGLLSFIGMIIAIETVC
tara:strand:- start:1182 stop:1415 length:234 start_codon:yes stop_codon:yes gene_type:complete